MIVRRLAASNAWTEGGAAAAIAGSSAIAVALAIVMICGVIGRQTAARRRRAPPAAEDYCGRGEMPTRPVWFDVAAFGRGPQ